MVGACCAVISHFANMFERFLKCTYFLDVKFSEVGSEECVYKLQAFRLLLACSDFLSMQAHALKGLLDFSVFFPRQIHQDILGILAIILEPILHWVLYLWAIPHM